MSAIDAPAIVPASLFKSVFKNISDHEIYAPWAHNGHGANIAPGETFTVDGDPRNLDLLPRSHKFSDSISAMMAAEELEFVSSPTVIIDDQVDNNASVGLFGGDSPTLSQIPINKAAAEVRTLPNVGAAATMTAVYSATDEVIHVNWATVVGLEPFDKFSVRVTPPNGGSVINVSTGSDRNFDYEVENGDGAYKFLVTLTAIDGRTQAGTEKTVTVTSGA